MKSSLSTLLMGLVITSCSQQNTTSSTTVKIDSQISVYSGGQILTMAGDKPEYTEAIVVENDKISFVGSKKEALAIAGENYNDVDLAGKVLLPGFIDAHAHFSNFATQAVGAQLLMPMAIIHFIQFGRDPILGRMAVMIGDLHIFTLAASEWDGPSV